MNFQVGGIAQVNRAFQSVEQAFLRQETARTRAADKGAKDRNRLEQKAAKEKEKSIAEMAKRVDKSLATETKSVEKAEKEKQRAIDTSARYMERVRDRSATMAGNLAKRQADVEIREAKRANAARAKYYKTIGGAGASSFRGLVGGATSMAAGALTLGGGFAIADTIHKRLAAEKSASLLVNQVTTGGVAPKGADVNSILSRASATSIATGMSKEELVGGALAYSRKAKGGDFEGAMANMSFFAKMAKTTGADINDISEAAGTLQSQNPKLKAPEMQQMLLDVYAQGKAGSMSMVDVAKQVGTLASTRNSYQGDSASNQRKLLALGQLAAPQGSIEEAGTFIKDMTLEAGKHSKELKAMGVKYNKTGQMESPEQMIDAVFKGTKGDQTKIEKLFGARGTQLFGALGTSYNAAGGGDKGIAAVNEEMKKVTQASMSSADLEKQFAQVMATNSEKMEVALTKIENALESKLLPYLDKFADKLPELMPKFETLINAADKLVSWFLDNPLLHAGELMAGKIVLDITKAGIGAKVKETLDDILEENYPRPDADATANTWCLEASDCPVGHRRRRDRGRRHDDRQLREQQRQGSEVGARSHL